MKTINETQIKKIEEFLEKKDIIYSDLKMELVDHICSGIENQWGKNPNLSFDKAFHNEYKYFGIFGFSELLEKRKMDLKSYYWKSIGLHLINWFKVPQILLTLIIGYAIYWLMSSEYNIWARNLIVSLGISLSVLRSIQLQWRIKRHIKLKQPIMVMDNVLSKAGMSTYYIFMIIQGQIINYSPQIFTNSQLWVWTISLTIFSLLVYLIVFDFPKNKEKYFRHNYIMA